MVTLEEHPATDEKIIYRVIERYSDRSVEVLTRLLPMTMEQAIATEERNGFKVVLRGVRDYGTKRLRVYEIIQ